MPELRPYQLEAVKEILDKKRVLIADDMGLGKCAEAIAAKSIVDKRQGYVGKALVVCPASVAEHWEDEIRLWYRKGDDTRITKLQASTYNEDIEESRRADFSIVGYPTLSYLGNQASQIKKLNRIGFQYGIIDEAHNAKNPNSIRSMATKELFDSIEYLAILTGTPIPNSVIDIYMMLSLLNPERFPINSDNPRAILSSFYNLFRREPDFVKEILTDPKAGRMLRRTVDMYLNTKFPELRHEDILVSLDGEHREAYIKVYENDDLSPAAKLIQLRQVALDPNLAHLELLGDLASRKGKMESGVYKSLDELVARVVDSRGKILVFSDFKEGVTDFLQRRYAKYGAEIIDGDVSSAKREGAMSIREEIRKKFQTDPNCKILIATTVMDEGVDLTAASDIVHLTIPYTPAALDQRIRRSQRIGEVQKDSVISHIIKTRIDDFVPVISEGLEQLLNDKRRIITYLLEQPFLVSRSDLEKIKNGPEKSKDLAPYITSPIIAINNHLHSLKAQGFRWISEYYEKHPQVARNIARLYATHWEGYYAGNTATLYGKVIHVLEEKGKLEKRIDIASGPFSLSRVLKEPVVNIDINPYMLEAGRILEDKGVVTPGNIAHQAPFHQLPLEDRSFDIAVCSLAMHTSRLKLKYRGSEIREREQVLREMNRVLRDGGYGIITLPYSVIAESDFEIFYKALNQLGFDVLPFSGFYNGKKESKKADF